MAASAAASGAARVALVVPADAPSPFRAPPSLPRYTPHGGGDERVAGEPAAWLTVAKQTAQRLEWAEPGRVDVFAVASDDEALFDRLADADVVVTLGSDALEEAEAKLVGDAAALAPTLIVLGAESGELPSRQKLNYSPSSALEQGWLNPFGRAAKDVALLRQVQNLYSNSDVLDLQFALALLASDALGTRLPSVAAADKIDLPGYVCLARNCRKQVVDCVRDDMCKTALDCLDECGMNDQVCSYRCLRSYETPLFTDFALCVMQKHNCMNNDAKIQTLPEVSSITTWRGEPLTDESAQRIYEGHFLEPMSAETAAALGGSWGSEGDPTPFSWRVIAGQNAAYDQFPCQYQIFYAGGARSSMWYQPVFRVDTLDGRNVWRVSDYRCRRERDEPPGAYELTFCDNGVVSREKWRIAGAADDLSWGLFFYRGAAERAGQAYIGAVLASADGKWPPAEQMPDVEAALNACGIELWEMYEVCNKSCEAPPLEPIHALNKRYGERGRNLLETASCLEAASA